MGIWRQNMVLMKYPKILTGVLPEILIQCRPKIYVLFRNPKIFDKQNRPWVFGVKNHGS